MVPGGHLAALEAPGPGGHPRQHRPGGHEAARLVVPGRHVVVVGELDGEVAVVRDGREALGEVEDGAEEEVSVVASLSL